MKTIIKKFNESGPCEMNIEKSIKLWTDKFSISQYHEDYTLVKQGRGKNCAKVSITKGQAQELIEKLNLIEIQSSIFTHGKTYRTKENILSEIERIEKIKIEKTQELQTINSILNEFKNALNDQ